NTSSGAGLQGSIGQSNYAAAKAGIAGLTLVQAAELARYGITVNCLAPAARTSMTEGAMPELVKKPEAGFDVWDPLNVAAIVVWLGSPLSASVTGRCFEAKGGELSVADGWRTGTIIDKGARWDPAELSTVVQRLIDEGVAPQKVYGT
ncbi:SDR family NAD(P)-dependent oxidoreductase, partial [Pseudorhodoferax sp.]|uniref:SDR family NAD(P)-dependent oxidoreductase n=1 Tax=Pseudorhodoferax sp. TaxID=1993553 RepID=UPI002DD64655